MAKSSTSTSTELSPVLINDVPCFVFNQHHSVPIAELCRICKDHFDSKDILVAKRILYDFCTPAERCVNHRDFEKNIEDIVNVLNSDKLDDTVLPVFAVSDLSRIPSVAPFHVDSSQIISIMRQLQTALNTSQVETVDLRKDVKSLRDELREFSTLRSELDATRLELARLKSTVDLLNVPGNQGTGLPLVSSSAAQQQRKPVSSNNRQASRTKLDATAPTFSSVLTRTTDERQIPLTVPKRMKEVAKDSQPASATSNSDGAQWHTVKPRKHLVRLGTKPSERIRVVKPRSTVSLFVSRIDPDVTVDEMKSQIEESFENVSNIIKLNSKFDSYASFKVTLSF